MPAGEFEQVQDYMGPRCRQYILDWYLDGTVDGYTRQQCQDQDAGELACDGCDPEWEDHEVPMTLIAEVVSPRGDSPSPMLTTVERPTPWRMVENRAWSVSSESIQSQVQRARSASSKSIQSQVRRARSVSSKSIQSQVQRARSVSSKSIQSQVPQARPIAHMLSPAHSPPVPASEFKPVRFDRAAIQVEAARRQAGLNKEQGERAARQWQD
ncbi:hypothetical protein BJX76DRAFT_363212 [Aspergillus varians]